MNKNFAFIIIVSINLFVANIIFFQSKNENYYASLVLLTCFILLSMQYAYIASSSKLKLVSFSLLLFWCYGMTMPGLFQVRNNEFYWASSVISGEIIISTSWIYLASIISYLIGYHLSKFNNTNKIQYSVNYNSLSNKIATVLVVSIALSYSMFSFSAIGIEPFLSTRATASLVISDLGIKTTGVGLMRTLPGSLAITAFLICAYQMFILNNRIKLIISLTWISFILMFLTNFPISIPRFTMVSIFFVIGLTVGQYYFKKYKFSIYASAPILLFLIFPFLGQFNRSDDLNLNFSAVSPAESMLHGDFDGFQSMMNAFNLVEIQGEALGGRLLSSLFFFIPRSIWDYKFDPTGSEAARLAGYQFFNISMPLPGEFYADFGFIGMFVCMIIFGRFIKYLDIKIENHNIKGMKIEISMIAIIVAAYMPIIFRGSLLAVIGPTIISVALVILWGMIRRIKTRN